MLSGILASMTSAITTIFGWGLRLVMVGFMIFSFILIYNLIIAFTEVGLNGGVIGEIMGIIQMWLPFNLGQMVNFLTNAASLLIMYYMYVYGLKMVRSVLGNNA